MADNNLPYEYQSTLVAAERRKALAEALQKQAFGFQGAQGGGRITPKTSPLSWLANTATGYLASQGAAGADAKKAEVLKKAAEDRRAEMLALIQAPEDQQQALGVQGKFSETGALAQNLYKQKQDKLKSVMGAIEKMDPAYAANIGISGKLPAEYKAPAAATPQFGTAPSGDAYGFVRDPMGKVDFKFAPKGVKIDTGTQQETAAARAVGGKVPEIFEGITGAAKNAISSIESADRIDALLKNPATITGFGAGPLAGLAGLGTAMGFQGPDAAAKTQALLSELANQTLASVKRLPGAITEKERPFLELASAGKIDFTPEAIQRLADVARMASHNTLIGLQSEYAGASAAPGAQETGAPGIWPFPKGWKFSVDPKKYVETGSNTNRYQYIGDLPTAAQAKPVERKPVKVSDLTPQQKDELRRMLGEK